ncbi:MAG TPA: efflux RND transporter periplasmic adaptor subunit [Solibacterales bacterium]|nr:efflux RND transporter periplasmic adaptor subunit [Bryobacterales bacterium]
MFYAKPAVSVALLVALAGCGAKEQPARKAESSAPPLAVRVASASMLEWPSAREAAGTVKAKTTASVSAKVMGYVREVRVSAGHAVRAGDLLVVLDARDLDTGVQQAEAARAEAASAMAEAENGILGAKAQLGLAEATFERMKTLYGRKSISPQEFDEATARLRLAQAGHEAALSKRDQLKSRIRQAEAGVTSASIARGYSEVRAPFAGVITERRVEPGNLATPGAPLLMLEETGAYRLEAMVEESMSGAVRIGQVVRVRLEALGLDTGGRVSEIVPAVDPASRGFLVKIDLPSAPGVRSGVYGTAEFGGPGRTVLAVPAAAIREQGQLLSVMVASGGMARLRLVTAGARRGDVVEILSGLDAGETVVSPLPAALVDGSRVEVRP